MNNEKKKKHPILRFLLILFIVFVIFCIWVMFDDEEECYDCYSSNDDYCYDCNEDGEYYSYYEADSSAFPHGTANSLEGNVLVVPIFANDTHNCSWDNADPSTKNNILQYMNIATSWLTIQASDYGKNVSFIYDWTQYPDILFDMTYDGDFLNSDSYDFVNSFIYDNIDYSSLMTKYNSDNLIFMLHINTPSNNYETSYAYSYCEDCYGSPFEICYMFAFLENEAEAPAAYAHEMMHTFGAKDLYYEESNGIPEGIPMEYLDYLDQINSPEIMRTTFDPYTDEALYDKIANEFTPIDAYYVGIGERPSEADEWGLGKSEHE